MIITKNCSLLRNYIDKTKDIIYILTENYMKSDFEIIKKKYGENFARLCRTLFPTILDKKGLLPEILNEKFEPSKFLYEDITENYMENEFKNFIYRYANINNVEHKEVNETPEELFDKAGYKLYKCETNEEILSFKKYYKKGEELCTFRDKNRINNYTIFWAVKKNADKIKRENFTNPIRQDEYGTSVISLQFSKGNSSTLSIKNRYNHTVDNPDATFSNDLENIQPGLTDSFKKYYNIDLSLSSGGFELPNYVMADDGKFYRYNVEIDNTYFCPNNIIIANGKVVKLDKSQYEIIDYFILDKKNPYIYIGVEMEDAFVDAFYGLKKINIKKLENGEKLLVFTKKKEKFELIVNKYNQIIKYTNNYINIIGKDFLKRNNSLIEFTANNVREIGDGFLYWNKKLKTFNTEKLKEVGINFLYENKDLINFNANNLEIIGEWALTNNEGLEVLNLPKVKEIGSHFMASNNTLKELSLKNLHKLGSRAFAFNKSLQFINLPKLKEIKEGSFEDGSSLTYINLPKVKHIERCCLTNINENNIEYINFDSIEKNMNKTY